MGWLHRICIALFQLALKGRVGVSVGVVCEWHESRLCVFLRSRCFL